MFEKASLNDWNAVIKARVQGAWNLHHALQGHQLNFFVMLSSLSGIIGNRGQAVYAASNTFMDASAGYRSRPGLPATTIDIGVVAGVGYVAEHEHREAQIRAVAHDLVTEKELPALIKAAINCDPKGGYSHQILAGCKLVAESALPWWAADPKFSHIVRGTQTTSETATSKDTTISVRESLKQASSAAETQQVIEEALVGKVAGVSMTPVEDIDLEKPLAAYGMDSLVAVQIRNWIANEMAANIPALEFIASASLAGLTEVFMTKSTFVKRDAEAAPVGG